MSDEYDFGFNFLSEEELRQQEEILKKQVEEQAIIVNISNEKLHKLKNMIMPFLKNLLKEPDKKYVEIPNRLQRVNDFIDKINNLVDG